MFYFVIERLKMNTRLFRQKAQAFLSIHVPVFMLFTILFITAAIIQKNNYQSRIEFKEVALLVMEKRVFEATMNDYVADATVFTDLTKLGMQSSSKVTYAAKEKGLADLFLAHMRHHSLYDQVRLLDKKGNEKLRINRRGQAQVEIVADVDLQLKADRPYFVKGFSQKNVIYISSFDLNMEEGVVEKPVKPMLRIATRVTNSDPDKERLLVLNLRGIDLLEQLARLESNSIRNIYLVNNKGQWLKGPSKEVEWLFMQSKSVKSSLTTEFPEVSPQILTQNEGQVLTPKGLLTYVTIDPKTFVPAHLIGSKKILNEETWKLISFVPKKKLYPEWWDFVIAGFMIGAIFITLMAVYVTYYRFRRLQDLAKLQKSEQQLATITSSVWDAIVMINSKGIVSYWNDAAEKLFGFTREEMLGTDIHASVTPETERVPAANGLKIFATTGQGPLIGTMREVVALRKDGTNFPAELNLNSVKIQNKWVAVGVIRDISKRKQVEKELAANEAMFRAIFNNTYQFIGILSVDGTIIEVNQTAMDFAGLTKEGMQGKKLWELSYWSYERGASTRLKKALKRAAKGAFINYEVEIVGRGQRPITLDFSISPVFDENGQVVLLLPEGHDISHIKKTENALATRELQLQMFIKHTPAAIAIFDRDMKYIVASDRWYQDYNIIGEDIIGKSHYEVFPEIKNIIEWKKIHKQCLKGEVISKDEDSFLRTDGQHDWLRWEVRPWKESSGEIGGIIVFTEVITKRKNAEAQILALNEDLEKRVEQRTIELQNMVESISEKQRVALLLKEIASTANTAHSVKQALLDTLQLIAAYTGWPIAHVYTISVPSGMLVPTNVWYLKDKDKFKKFIEVTKRTIFSPGEGLPGRIYSSGHVLWIEDISTDDSFTRSGRIQEHNIHGAFGIPVNTSNGIAAIIEVFSTQIEPANKFIIEMAEEVGNQLGYVIDRKRIEENVRESENKFRVLFDNTIQQLGILTSEGRVIQINDPALEFAGVNNQDVEGKFFWDTPWWQHSKELQEQIKKAVKDAAAGQLIRFETTSLDSNDCLRDLDFSLKPVIDDTGNVLYLIPEGRDITSRKQVEQEIKKLALVVEQTSEGVLITDKKGRVEWINDGFVKISGYSIDDMRGKKPGDMLQGPETNPTVVRRISEALTIGKNIKEELINYHKDGSKYWLELNIQPIFDENGNLDKFIAITTDISHRKKDEEALSQFKTTLDQVHDAVFIFCPETLKFQYVNQGAINQLGYSFAEFVEKTVVDVKAEYNEDQFRQMIAPLISGEAKSLSFETLHENAEGQLIPVDVLLQYLCYQKDSPRFVAVVRNITEKKAITIELEKAKKEAEKASVAKGDFLANMSHEIRTPMNAIVGISYLLQNTELNSQQKDYLQKIINSSQSLLAIINNILDYSKIEAQQMEIEQISFNLLQIQTNLVDIVGSTAEKKGLELLFSIDENVPLDLVGDPLRLHQILTNLINNSLKFTKKGEVVVSISQKHKAADKVKLHFTVKDTGIGMTQKQLQLLFKPFSQGDSSTTRNFGGTGLGLAICRQLVEIMGGKIWVESIDGHGSSFHFELIFGVESTENTLTFNPSSGLQGLQVLVVDDNSTFQNITKEMLESFSFKVKLASTGEQAISVLEEASERNDPIQLVLIDWNMPGLDGIETSRRIKSSNQLQGIHTIIMVSAFGREGVVKQAEKIGLDGFLVKPLNRSLLFDTIMESFGKKGIFHKPKHDVDKTNVASNLPFLKGAKVLLVEDNPINQEVGRELLDMVGVITHIVSNGQEALEAVADMTFDAVLMDIQMPIMDGFDATRLIRQQEDSESHLPILAMTANVLTTDKKRAEEAGMDDYIDKPITPALLYSTLAKWIVPHTDKVNYLSANLEQKNISQNEFVLPELPGLNGNKGLERLNDNVDLYLQILQRFVAEQTCSVEQISSAIDTKDFETAERLVHTLKGLASTLGAAELALVSKEVESVIISNSRVFNNESLEPLQKELELTLRSAKKLVEFIDKENNTLIELEPFDILKAQHQFDQLEMFLKNDSYEANLMMVEVCNVYDISHINDIVQLKKMVEEYNYSEALVLISKIKQIFSNTSVE